MKMYSVKNGELQCKEVDASNGMVVLGVNDVVVPDGKHVFKTITRGSGRSWEWIDKAKIIREDLEKATNYSYEPPVSINADKFEYDHTAMDASLINKIVSGIDVNRDIDYRPITNIQIHEKICKELTETYKKKNADYGNSFEKSLDKHGLIAGIIRMDDKMSRLISLNSKNEQLVLDESLRDTLMDLANYAIMSVMWLDEQ